MTDDETAPPPDDEQEPVGPAGAPMWDRDAEESLIGVMLAPYGDTRAWALREVDPADFYNPWHRAVFEAIADLHAAGDPVDVVTVAAKLAEHGDAGAGLRDRLRELSVSYPASGNAQAYAAVVRRHAWRRRVALFGEELDRAARDPDPDILAKVVAEAPRALADVAPGNVETDDLTDLWALAEVEDVEPSRPWVLPGCLRQGEVMILTGSEGGGKMTLLRQIGGCLASGIHPFTGLSEGMVRHRVLMLDLQEDRVDQAAEMAKLRSALVSHYEPGWFHAVSWQDGVDLMAPGGRRRVEGALEVARPELVLAGPLINTFRAPPGRKKYDEDVVDEVTAVWADLMARFGFGLMLEAHSGNTRGSDSDWRARGSSVWRSWPAFSHGLKLTGSKPREAEVVRARPDRYADRAWPTRLYENPAWRYPWQVSDEDYGRVIRAMGLHWLLGEAEQPSLEEQFADPPEPPADGGDEPF